MAETNLVVVHTFGSEPEAEMARTLLEAAGVDSMLQADTAGGMRHHLAWSGLGFRILVREEDATAAREVLEFPSEICEALLKQDPEANPVGPGNRGPGLTTADRPAMVTTKRLKDGTPVRGACPLCGVEFSTEAFDGDKTYPHESTLDRWYAEHSAGHIEEF
jgi:hypothetical protein